MSVRVRFSLSTSYEAPADPDGMDDVERAFLPQAARFRKHQQAAFVLMFGGIVFAWLAMAFPEAYAVWLGVPGVALIGCAHVAMLAVPRLECPSCRHDLTRLERYCPRCGAQSVELRPWRGNRCRACGRGLGVSKTRSFPIRFCTHCGVLVDRKGI
jgi:hypothetical protein